MTLLKQSTIETEINRPSPNQKRKVVIAALLSGALIMTATVWWLASPLLTNIVVDEPFPFGADSSTVINSGEFVDMNFLHRGSGSATILQQGDQRLLRLEDFQVTNGPDLQVLLVENINEADNDSFGDTIDLGALKGNIGNQNYEIPAEIDLAKYSGVMIYCEPFSVVFSTAAFGG